MALETRGLLDGYLGKISVQTRDLQQVFFSIVFYVVCCKLYVFLYILHVFIYDTCVK